MGFVFNIFKNNFIKLLQNIIQPRLKHMVTIESILPHGLKHQLAVVSRAAIVLLCTDGTLALARRLYISIYIYTIASVIMKPDAL